MSLLRPYEDFQLRADQCARAYDMCEGLSAPYAAWERASGTDARVHP